MARSAACSRNGMEALRRGATGASGCMRRNAWTSNSSIPLLDSAFTFAADCEHALQHTLGVFRVGRLEAGLTGCNQHQHATCSAQVAAFD
jgi:hypothetical protein